MINQLLLLGKIKKFPMLDKIVEDNEFIIEVTRNYKNVEGIYEKDQFRCHLWIALSKKISVRCNEGDMIMVKGRLESKEEKYKIIAEQIILLNKGASI